MTLDSLIQRLRNIPVRKLIKALERDGFSYRRRRGSGRVYRHPDGRRIVIHYHRGGDTLPIETLRNFLETTGWREEDLQRLRLLR